MMMEKGIYNLKRMPVVRSAAVSLMFPQEQVIFKVVVNTVMGLMITAFGKYSPKA